MTQVMLRAQFPKHHENGCHGCYFSSNPPLLPFAALADCARPAKPRWGRPAAEVAGQALWPAAVGEQSAQSRDQDAADTESIT
ncbi:hypothetical protein [Nocardia sp. NPDC059239]|uniref:hypothetical protein n=1 Tax=Nocardia sp. NPDC059239 TaxID=3346785 RepID=UPI0036AB7B17